MKTIIKQQLILIFLSIIHLSLSAQTAHSVRNISRNASTEIDAAYTNPAGLIKLNDGIYISIHNQSTFQTQTITSISPIFLMNGGSTTKKFKGKSNTSFLPNLLGAYKKDKWVISGSIAMEGDRKTVFDNGLPSFEVIAGNSTSIINQSQSYKVNKYEVQSYLKHSNNIFHLQFGGTYELNKILSVYGGLKLGIAQNSYNGYIRELKMNVTPSNAMDYPSDMIYAEDLLEMFASNPNLTDEQRNQINVMAGASSNNGVQFDVEQSGFGVSPIVGININHEKLNIGIRYEIKTKIELKNNTKVDDIGSFPDKVKSPDDLPALLSIGLSYQLSPRILTSVGYNHIFERDARKSNDKQQYTKNTNEFQAGLEYRLNNKLLFSFGGQFSRPKVEDEYQSEIVYQLKSYTIGGGFSYGLTEKIQINTGYQWFSYSDYTKATDIGGTDMFSKSKSTFSIGLDYHF